MRVIGAWLVRVTCLLRDTARSRIERLPGPNRRLAWRASGHAATSRSRAPLAHVSGSETRRARVRYAILPGVDGEGWCELQRRPGIHVRVGSSPRRPSQSLEPTTK